MDTNKMYLIDHKTVLIIREIFYQIGGPVQYNPTVRKYTDLTPDLIKELVAIFDKASKENTDLKIDVFKYFALLRLLDYLLLDLGYYEFGTVTGLDFCKDGILVLDDLRYKFSRNE